MVAETQELDSQAPDRPATLHLFTEPVGFVGKDVPTDADLSRCVHCGLCLQACPTYRILGVEADSPRGRLFLIRDVAEKQRPLADDVRKHLDLCLVCRNCETVCPSGVRFGHLMEHARHQLTLQYPTSRVERLLRRLVFRELFPHPVRMRLFGWSMKLYQTLGLRAVVHRLGILPRLSHSLAAMERMLPPLPAFGRTAKGQECAAIGEERYRVAMLTGCVMPLAFGPTNEATIRVLQRNGCRVILPAGQICCGSLHAHMGEREEAKRLARRNIDIFEKAGAQYVVINAAGCGAMMKEYGELLHDDAAYAERAHRFSATVRDVSEFLASVPLTPPRYPVNARVTYQEPCHIAHAQKLKKQPRDILRAIPGLQLVEMRDSDRCCGSAGIYNIVHADLAGQLLQEKLSNIVATGADVVVSANPGCMMQLAQGLQEIPGAPRLVHIVDLLDEAYNGGPSYIEG